MENVYVELNIKLYTYNILLNNRQLLMFDNVTRNNTKAQQKSQKYVVLKHLKTFL